MEHHHPEGTLIYAGGAADAVPGPDPDHARGLVSVQGLRRAGGHAGWSPTQVADVGNVQPHGFDLGHFDAGRGRAKLAVMVGHASHFTSPAAATHLFSHEDSFQSFFSSSGIAA
jgi:hypothetical protein